MNRGGYLSLSSNLGNWMVKLRRASRGIVVIDAPLKLLSRRSLWLPQRLDTQTSLISSSKYSHASKTKYTSQLTFYYPAVVASTDTQASLAFYPPFKTLPICSRLFRENSLAFQPPTDTPTIIASKPHYDKQGWYFISFCLWVYPLFAKGFTMVDRHICQTTYYYFGVCLAGCY